jgi:hypothetical protein
MPSKPSQKVAYISGPMTGRPDFNYPEFDRVATYLRKRGFVVISPSETAGGVSHMDRSWYLTHDFMTILTSVDLIVVLEGWKSSAGSIVEIMVAASVGIPAYSFYLPEGDSLDEVVHLRVQINSLDGVEP